VGCIDTTVSIGLAALDADTPDLEGLLDHADHALYAAKAAGRNRVAVWHVGMAPARIG
jgi:diguanylate cyclase (GGDEF)-like protein